MNQTRITAVQPRQAVEGGRVSIHGVGFPIDQSRLPEVSVSDRAARVVYASETCLDVIVPSGFPNGGSFAVRIDGESSDAAVIDVARPVATDLHQVDSPVCDRDGNVYVTFSGKRGQQVPVSIFRIRPDGTRDAFARGVTNATSLAVDPQGHLYVSSRFEGTVYRLDEDGNAHTFATDLGVPCGLVFSRDGALYVGDRSGTIFKVNEQGRATALASLEPSVAAFHLAVGPDDALYVTGPTLASRDSVYRVSPSGAVTTLSEAFGRPQGLAFDSSGRLFVVDALAGASGVYRLREGCDRELVVAGVDLIGIAFDPSGDMLVCSADSLYRLRHQAV
jgi:sugar lactone lactonase YvrE